MPAIPKQAVHLESEVVQLKAELARIKAPETNAQYYFNTVTVVIEIAAALITLIAVIVTIFGYQVFRHYMSTEIAAHTNSAYENHGRPVIDSLLKDADDRVSKALEESRIEFAEAVEQVRKLTLAGQRRTRP